MHHISRRNHSKSSLSFSPVLSSRPPNRDPISAASTSILVSSSIGSEKTMAVMRPCLEVMVAV